MASAQSSVQAVGAHILSAAADAAAVARCGLSAALSGDAAVKALSQAVAVEAVTAVMHLRLIEVRGGRSRQGCCRMDRTEGDDLHQVILCTRTFYDSKVLMFTASPVENDSVTHDVFVS